MNENFTEEMQEIFEGDIRKFDDLISEIQLWSDVSTINHKKEQQRLERYVELSKTFYELKETIDTFIEETPFVEAMQYGMDMYKGLLAGKYLEFKETELHINNWVREIEDMRVVIAKSDILPQYAEFIYGIIKAD